MFYNGDFLPPLERLFGRGGLVAPEPVVRGYADETHLRTGLDAVEVLAEAPTSATLPDRFEQTEVKYGRVKHLFEDPAYKLRRAWSAELEKVRVYVLDPKGIVKEVTSRLSGAVGPTAAALDREVAARIAVLHPGSWLHSVELRHGSATHRLPDPYAGARWLREEVEAARSKKGNFLVNVRRRVLRSQALNSDLLPYQPVRLDEDTGGFKWEPRTAPSAAVAMSLKAEMVYDEGHAADVERLLRGQEAKRGMVEALSREFRIPSVSASRVREVGSGDSELIQLADFAAGLAYDLYSDPDRRDRLPQTFRAVYVNGALMP